ncbi:Uncharacterised protein [uncultured archaeon]|nr:Uncharacterised protein [uncultured archaeon]
MNLIIWGLILDIIGVFILAFSTAVSSWHGKYNFPFWKKRYYWNGWRPFYRNTETKKLTWKWNHKPLVFGWIPPKYKLDIFGFLLILTGFILQLIFYLN